jgi:hypothetical protein
MNYLRLLVASAFAGAAFSASALDVDIIVETDQACPAGTFQKTPYYRVEGGRFVRDGWVCEDRRGRN